MNRLLIALILALFSLSACDIGALTTTTTTNDNGIFKIRSSDTGKIQFRMLDSINALRQASGLSPVQLSAQLNAAAATQSLDMSVQNRPWHFGSDGSSPIDRVARTGYTGRTLGENISETYEDDVSTLADWMEEDDTRSVILAPDARYVGISWFQEVNGKIWWTLVMGS